MQKADIGNSVKYSPFWWRRKAWKKIRRLVSWLIRCRPTFVRQNKIPRVQYLNVGCGENVRNTFINLDYRWQPGIDICWDITRKNYPLADNNLIGIYSEHCLEHIDFESCRHSLAEFFRLLNSGGRVRLVVPDGEIYMDAYQAQKLDPDQKAPYGEAEDTVMISINRVMRGWGHQFIYDFTTLRLLLQEAGFTDVEKCALMVGTDPTLLIDSADREPESLYVEAVKP